MKVITPGHSYELDHFEGTAKETLRFIRKVQIGEKLETVHDGTTNEEVIRALIDRIGFLNNKAPCEENDLAIGDLSSALKWLESRTKDRIDRGVEGTPKE